MTDKPQVEREDVYRTGPPSYGPIRLNGVLHQAKDHILKLKGRAAEEFRELLEHRHDISANVKLIDMAAAEALVAEHKASLKPQASTGAVVSTDKPGAEKVVAETIIPKPEPKVIPPGTPKEIKPPTKPGSSLVNRIKGNADHVLAEAAKTE